MGKKERWQIANANFIEHFDYIANLPEKIDDINNEWSDVLEKSVADNFDYTIEKYGTTPPKSFELPTIIYD